MRFYLLLPSDDNFETCGFITFKVDQIFKEPPTFDFDDPQNKYNLYTLDLNTIVDLNRIITTPEKLERFILGDAANNKDIYFELRKESKKSFNLYEPVNLSFYPFTLTKINSQTPEKKSKLFYYAQMALVTKIKANMYFGSYDFDGCTGKNGDPNAENFTKNNPQLVAHLSMLSQQLGVSITPENFHLFVGSSRQSHNIDQSNAKNKQNGSVFAGLQVFALNRQMTFNRTLLSDLLHRKKYGYVMEHPEDPYLDLEYFEQAQTKITFVIPQMHIAKFENSNKEIYYEFIDNDTFVLYCIKHFCESFSEFLPKGVTVVTARYCNQSFELGHDDLLTVVRGSGETLNPDQVTLVSKGLVILNEYVFDMDTLVSKGLVKSDEYIGSKAIEEQIKQAKQIQQFKRLSRLFKSSKINPKKVILLGYLYDDEKPSDEIKNEIKVFFDSLIKEGDKTLAYVFLFSAFKFGKIEMLLDKNNLQDAFDTTLQENRNKTMELQNFLSEKILAERPSLADGLSLSSPTASNVIASTMVLQQDSQSGCSVPQLMPSESSSSSMKSSNETQKPLQQTVAGSQNTGLLFVVFIASLGFFTVASLGVLAASLGILDELALITTGAIAMVLPSLFCNSADATKLTADSKKDTDSNKSKPAVALKPGNSKKEEGLIANLPPVHKLPLLPAAAATVLQEMPKQPDAISQRIAFRHG